MNVLRPTTPEGVMVLRCSDDIELAVEIGHNHSVATQGIGVDRQVRSEIEL